MNSWRYIEDDNVTADFGLAGDEFLMSCHGATAVSSEPTLRLYTYRSHCALVGRFQNIEAELNLEACRILNVQFSRRPTGGGAILMGAQQLGLCVAASGSYFKDVVRPIEIYQHFSAPVIRALDRFGIQAKFRPKNDLEVNGRKIAGLGVAFDPHGAMLFHTSLIVDLDIPLMLQVLRIPAEKISDKVDATHVAERITTISRELGQTIDTNSVRRQVKARFEEMFQIKFRPSPWKALDRIQIAKLAKDKYADDEWIFQRTPQPDMTGMSVKKTPGGLLRTYISLKGEIIKSLLITGDFFEGSEVFKRVEARLKWSPLEKSTIADAVAAAFATNGGMHQHISCAQVTDAIWKAGINARAQSRLSNRGSCYFPKHSDFENRSSLQTEQVFENSNG